MRSNLVVLVIACFVVAVSATCQLPAIAPYDQLLPFKFVTIGQVCNGVNPLIQPVDTSLSITDPERGCTSCCKNFQTCLPSNDSSAESGLYTCNEISQNATCDPTWATLYNINPCGPTMQCLPVNGDPTDNRCFVVDHLENGAVCIINEQCQSRNCAPNMTLATGFGLRRAVNVTGLPFCQPLDPLQPCNSQADCPAHQWCNLANNSCMAPIPQNGDCSAIASYYNTTMDLPNYVCAPGTACLRSVNAKTGASYSCVAYYTQSKNNPTCYRDAWWNCQFGYYCNTSDVDESASAQGTCIVSNQAGAIGDKCKNFPLTSGGQSECYWGTGCSCFTTTNNSNSGQCTRMYNTNCPIQLRNLVSCISSNKCPHDGAQLLGGNASPYAASTVVGSCIQTYCSSEHANLIKCQNDINSPNSIVSPAFIPTTYPNNDYTNGSSGLQGWEIGLIIVGIAVAIIIIVVIVVAIVRRKSNSAYQPLE